MTNTAPLHFLAPERPRISGLPAFRTDMNPGGLSIIPGLYCSPIGDGTEVEISGFFSSGPNRSTRKVLTIRADCFAAFWTRWLADPEGVAEREFGWVPLPQGATPSATPTLDLNDLLGDF
jgi:hypothetical protein